jgi:hypothetical protein
MEKRIIENPVSSPWRVWARTSVMGEASNLLPSSWDVSPLMIRRFPGLSSKSRGNSDAFLNISEINLNTTDSCLNNGWHIRENRDAEHPTDGVFPSTPGSVRI